MGIMDRYEWISIVDGYEWSWRVGGKVGED